MVCAGGGLAVVSFVLVVVVTVTNSNACIHGDCNDNVDIISQDDLKREIEHFGRQEFDRRSTLYRVGYVRKPVLYYSNSCASFNVSLLICGDVECNIP